MTRITLTLYTRPGCHLCDEMKDVVEPVARDYACTLEEIDISGDAALEGRFGQEIPVLFVDGRKAFKYHLTERELRRRLRR
jgi:glutaredoxin